VVRALQVEGLLHRHRQAVQRAPQLAARQRRVGLAGALQGTVEVTHHDGIDQAVMALDARQEVLQQLNRGKLAAAQAQGQIGGAEVGDVVHSRDASLTVSQA
jgi:hypothetical protein